MNTDLLQLAEAAWRAGSDELEQASKLPIPAQEPAHRGTLLISDAFMARQELDTPTGELAKDLGDLRALIAQAMGADSAELGTTETAIEARIETVGEHTRDLRALREKYEARWGKGV